MLIHRLSPRNLPNYTGDTFTVPTDAQLLASLKATRGDDVYQEDPDTMALEARLAKMTGKEAALFCSSGTMTNRISLLPLLIIQLIDFQNWPFGHI
jgi:threonine aldolase